MNRLYQQRADAARIGDYVRRWSSWVQSGLHHFELAAVKRSRYADADKLRQQLPAVPQTGA
jgi:hypothetical protein